VTKERSSGVAHDIAHHAGSGLGYLMPHLGQALREASLKTTAVELLDEEPYPSRKLIVETMDGRFVGSRRCWDDRQTQQVSVHG
jgi:hypothetical protein